jgi:hypothetical protein
MNIEKLIKDISTDTTVFFHTFEQVDDVIIAKSHFLDFHFGPTSVAIALDYILPGPKVIEYSNMHLPILFDYNEENFYDRLIDSVVEIKKNLNAAEYQDENRE